MTVYRRFARLGISLAVLATACFLWGSVALVPQAGAASSTTSSCTGTLTAEGGSFFAPVIQRLFVEDQSNLSPECPQYNDVNLNQGIADFVGTGKGQFQSDIAVSERPLTSAETSTATTDDRSFAYVPIAATPVAVLTLVETAAYQTSGSSTFDQSDWCNGIDLTVPDLGAIFGDDSAEPFSNWDDSRIKCGGGGAPATSGYALSANGDPTMANYALMNLLDSNTTSKAYFDAGLTDKSLNPATGATDTPSETWPYGNTVIGGDQDLVEKLVYISTTTNAPDPPGGLSAGTTAPISYIWTGAPLGTEWDLPTAAIQNAQGSFVQPSEASAAAAQSDATLASTSSPTTDNLVTFNASSSDKSAYNNYLMIEDYLVVPTNGLDAQTATEVAQLIRYALGSAGQKVISSYGAAPATSAMVSAGLKVAAEVDSEGLSGSNGSTGKNGSSGSAGSSGSSNPQAQTTASGGSGSGGTGSGGSGSSGGDDGSGGSGSGSGSSGSLAYTGFVVWPLLAIGIIMVVVSEPARRLLRRRSNAR
jgi:hypothetical protein